MRVKGVEVVVVVEGEPEVIEMGVADREEDAMAGNVGGREMRGGEYCGRGVGLGERRGDNRERVDRRHFLEGRCWRVFWIGESVDACLSTPSTVLLT